MTVSNIRLHARNRSVDHLDLQCPLVVAVVEACMGVGIATMEVAIIQVVAAVIKEEGSR